MNKFMDLARESHERLRSARHVQTKMTHEAATYPDNTIPQLSLGEPALVGKLYVLNLYYVTGG